MHGDTRVNQTGKTHIHTHATPWAGWVTGGFPLFRLFGISERNIKHWVQTKY